MKITNTIEISNDTSVVFREYINANLGIWPINGCYPLFESINDALFDDYEKNVKMTISKNRLILTYSCD